jgi:MFS family permease
MAHALGMFGLSIVNGALLDRIGRKAAIGAGAALLIAGSLLAPVSLMTAWLALALFLVGLGWNLCYIAGSSPLWDVLAPADARAPWVPTSWWSTWLRPSAASAAASSWPTLVHHT